MNFATLGSLVLLLPIMGVPALRQVFSVAQLRGMT